MARNKSGDGVDDYLADTSGNRLAGEKVGFYRDRNCTQRITDLLDGNGGAVTELTTDAEGYWGIVQFPDDGTTYAYVAHLHPSNGAPIAPGRIVDSHTAFLNLSGEKGQANGYATLDTSGNVVQPVPYANIPDPPNLGIYARKAEVPSVEEVAVSVSLLWSGQTTPITRLASDTTQRDAPLLSLPFDWYLHSVDLVWNATIAASDANYWTVVLQNYDAAGTPAAVATKTTQATGGEAVTGDKPWRFNTGALDVSARLFGADQVLRLLTTPTGTPADLTGPSIAVVRYARQ